MTDNEKLEQIKEEYTLLLNRFLRGSDIMMDLYAQNSEMRRFIHELKQQQNPKPLAAVPPPAPVNDSGCAV